MDVAITGLGVISSIGLDIETFNANLSANRPKISPSPWSNEPETASTGDAAKGPGPDRLTIC